jgi:hypothetical protein
VEVYTTGDGFLAFFDGAAQAVRCAAAVRDGALQDGPQIRGRPFGRSRARRRNPPRRRRTRRHSYRSIGQSQAMYSFQRKSSPNTTTQLTIIPATLLDNLARREFARLVGADRRTMDRVRAGQMPRRPLREALARQSRSEKRSACCSGDIAANSSEVALAGGACSWHWVVARSAGVISSSSRDHLGLRHRSSGRHPICKLLGRSRLVTTGAAESRWWSKTSAAWAVNVARHIIGSCDRS